MRRALQEILPKSKQGTSWTTHVSAPVGGWNTRDSLAEMAPQDAVTLTNWFPRAGQCEARGGYTDFATGMMGAVKSLFQYTPPSLTTKFYAVTDAGVYNITAGGAVGAVEKALTNGYINGTTLVNSAGTAYYWFANGTDDPVVFNGTTWTSLNSGSSPAITGVTAANLAFPWVFKHRIFCIERNSMNMWYLPIDSIAGAATQFPMGNLFKLGGNLNAGTSWTLDSGSGPDDLLAVITTEGELAVYKGTNPASASSWEIVGVWYVGKPLSRRCFFKLGGDVGVLVANGIFMLSELLSSGETNFNKALSSKIQPTVSDAVRANGTSTQGWEGCVFADMDALVVNVPDGTQWVMNTTTRAWAKFTGWAAKCFVVVGSALFFGRSDGTVQQAWDGQFYSDDGVDIVTEVQQSWNYLGTRTKMKSVDLFRPLLSWNGAVSMNWGLGSDYSEINLSSYYPKASPTTLSKFGSAVFGTATFQASLSRYKKWLSAFHTPGFVLSLRLQTASNDSRLTWSGTDFVVNSGGVM